MVKSVSQLFLTSVKENFNPKVQAIKEGGAIMSQSFLRPDKVIIIFTLEISKHARHTESEDCKRNILSYLFHHSSFFFCLYAIFSPVFSIIFLSHMFHLTIQRKMLELKEVLCFHSESWELFFVGFFFQIFNYAEKGRES